jgi:hypothetical protein
MSGDIAGGRWIGDSGWMIPTLPDTMTPPLSLRAQSVELLTRRRGDCLELEARIRRARRELGPARSGGLEPALAEIEADLGTYAGLLAEREVRLGWARPLLVPRGGGGSSEAEVPLGAAITAFLRRARGGVPEAERLGDLESAGLLAEIARVGETWLWSLSAVPDSVWAVRQPYSEAIR